MSDDTGLNDMKKDIMATEKSYGCFNSEKTPGVTYSVDDAVNHAGFGKFQIQLLLLAGFGWLADSFEIFVLSVLGDFLACDWQVHRWQNALLTSVVFVGVMIGSPIFGVVADIYGRKKCLGISMILIFIFGVGSAASPNLTWMISLKAALGFALGGVAQGLTLISEFCPASMRGRYLFYICYFWSAGTVGVMLVMWAVMATVNSWRILMVVVSIPALLVILSIKWYPESARFYLVSGQRDLAEATLAKMARTNGKDLPPGSIESVSINTRRGRIQNLFTPQLRKTTLLLWYIWLATAMSYYGIALLTPIVIKKGNLVSGNNGNSSGFAGDMMQLIPCIPYTTQNYIELLWTSFAEIPGVFLFTIIVDKMGRKALLTVSNLISAVLMLLLLLNASKVVILIVLFIARGILTALFQLTYIITSEVYPTTVRAIGMGSGVAFCRIGGLLVPFISQVLAVGHPIWAMCLLCGLLVLAAVASILIPFETRNANMKESH